MKHITFAICNSVNFLIQPHSTQFSFETNLTNLCYKWTQMYWKSWTLFFVETKLIQVQIEHISHVYFPNSGSFPFHLFTILYMDMVLVGKNNFFLFNRICWYHFFEDKVQEMSANWNASMTHMITSNFYPGLVLINIYSNVGTVKSNLILKGLIDCVAIRHDAKRYWQIVLLKKKTIERSKLLAV